MPPETKSRGTAHQQAALPDTNQLDLVVERYKFATPKNYSARDEAIVVAARTAEGILYSDIWGALQLDLVIGWGKAGPTYPKRREINDSHARWLSNWHIPPYEYESGIRWKPLDGMQQFDVQVDAERKEKRYRGLINMVA